MAGDSASESARRMRQKAERLARNADLYDKGAEGERATAAALAALPADSWSVFHDLRWPGRPFANVDHVAIGPAGVFVIDSKNWSGRVDVSDNVLRQNGRRREPAVNGVAEAALAVAGLTSALPPGQVFPVLCFVQEDPIAGWARDVMLCSPANIVEMLSTRPPVLDEATRRLVSLDLDASLRSALERPNPIRRPGRERPAGSHPRGHELGRFRASSGPARLPGRRPAKGSSGLSRPIAGLIVAVAALALVFSGAPSVLGKWFVNRIAAHDSAPAQEEPGRNVDSGLVLGKWSGKYTCGATVATGRLVISAVKSSTSDVMAVFSFGPSAESPEAGTGSYRLAGGIAQGVLTLTPGAWIERPPNYSPVGFEGAVSANRPNVLAGVIPECAAFEFRRDPKRRDR